MAGGGAFSPDIDAILKDLDRMVDRVDLSEPPDELLEDAAWLAACSKASDALGKLEDLFKKVR